MATIRISPAACWESFTDSETSDPVIGVHIDVIDGTQSDTTDETGYYEIPLPDGTFDLHYSKFGYEDHDETGIVILKML